MASSSALLRWICRRSFSRSSSFGKWTAGSGSYHQMSTVSEVKVDKSSPWLMLPPPAASEGVNNTNTLNFKFYSLAENKVVTFSGNGEKELRVEAKLTLDPNRNFSIRGSSLGWLALFNAHTLDLFLYNPISGRHIKLPPMRNLPNFPYGLEGLNATKVILSCSPDEDEENCRAVIIQSYIHMLAFCCPGRSKEWTPFGETRWWDEFNRRIWQRTYVDCVYSTRQDVFIALSAYGEVEWWDLRDLSFPRLIQSMEVDKGKIFNHLNIDESELVDRYHLVVAGQDLFMVAQYIVENVAPDGSYLDYSLTHGPYMTKDFNIQKYHAEAGEFKYVDGSSLGGLALFIGYHSHSVALPATHPDFPYLKPNSIYFTDTDEFLDDDGDNANDNRDDDDDDDDDDYDGYDVDDDQAFGGHDIGIFDYDHKIVSPCYFPCDVQSLKKIMPPPMWFFPSLSC